MNGAGWLSDNSFFRVSWFLNHAPASVVPTALPWDCLYVSRHIGGFPAVTRRVPAQENQEHCHRVCMLDGKRLRCRSLTAFSFALPRDPIGRMSLPRHATGTSSKHVQRPLRPWFLVFYPREREKCFTGFLLPASVASAREKYRRSRNRNVI